MLVSSAPYTRIRLTWAASLTGPQIDAAAEGLCGYLYYRWLILGKGPSLIEENEFSKQCQTFFESGPAGYLSRPTNLWYNAHGHAKREDKPKKQAFYPYFGAHPPPDETDALYAKELGVPLLLVAPQSEAQEFYRQMPPWVRMADEHALRFYMPYLMPGSTLLLRLRAWMDEQCERMPALVHGNLAEFIVYYATGFRDVWACQELEDMNLLTDYPPWYTYADPKLKDSPEQAGKCFEQTAGMQHVFETVARTGLSTLPVGTVLFEGQGRYERDILHHIHTGLLQPGVWWRRDRFTSCTWVSNMALSDFTNDSYSLDKSRPLYKPEYNESVLRDGRPLSPHPRVLSRVSGGADYQGRARARDPARRHRPGE